jgi:hypothetical protein
VSRRARRPWRAPPTTFVDVVVVLVVNFDGDGDVNLAGRALTFAT